jgi:pimeloyl-ACP methyl ester carboxylesterase
MPHEQTIFDETFKHHFAQVNGVKLHYVMGGQGAPLLLVHGYPETWQTWAAMMPALAENHTVIAVDMRGLGDSEITPAGYDKRNVAEDLHQLMENLGLHSFHLVAHDWAVSVAYALANAYPQTVSKLVLIEAPIAGFGLENAMNVAEGGLWHFGFFMSEYAEMLTAGKEREFLIDWAYQGHLVYNKDAFTPELIDTYIQSYTKPGGMTAGFNYYRTALEDIRYNRANFKGKLQMPVLAVGGEMSFGAGVGASLLPVAEDIESVVIPQSGHFISEEQPEALTQALLSFFAK